MVDLGDRMRSVVTGFEGIATARTDYINGCERYYLQPQVDDEGRDREGLWIDVEELEVIEPAAVRIARGPTGGGANPPRR